MCEERPTWQRGKALKPPRNSRRFLITGVVINDPIGALARLQLARAFVLTRDFAKARNAYEDFFNLWIEADPDIPVMKSAKAEYARL